MSRPLQVDLLTLKVVSESRVTWATSVPILVFLGLSVLDLGPMYTTNIRHTSSLNAPTEGRGITVCTCTDDRQFTYQLDVQDGCTGPPHPTCV